MLMPKSVMELMVKERKHHYASLSGSRGPYPMAADPMSPVGDAPQKPLEERAGLGTPDLRAPRVTRAQGG